MSDVDPYLIPGTGVLRNLVNAHSGQALNAAENDWVTFRFLQLQKTPLTAEGTVKQLQWIHHFLLLLLSIGLIASRKLRRNNDREDEGPYSNAPELNDGTSRIM
ncbi:hypothetical protein BPY_18980 [Bifidobacterium psychraerophilum]|jgi:hypothetical protein|uniref:Filamentation induced by cAMP protein Fic n=1 Tax=Bifidobacterium subtile TaxID=77635 RepID=A0A087E0R1_9BIFI|nr:MULTISPECIES: hypothetical protein [Bifidobacterium]KFJ01362.1 filamentation induced by cAMP protein Fic [Bifidobacterium subtile]MCH3974429.1 hypothetical protein [Bifidobacterium tibiigranuli]QOL37312.1 hypothetical protein BS3272_05330 [Bifidobacterium subtile]